MLKMIIVDDERKIRESMKNVVDWESLGISLIGLCKNGLEAYDMIMDESPDIVLTDIKMPGLSGLELISRITQIGQHVEFIILSGYGEFVYTKEAMKYGIKHYLLKPCNEEELIGVVKEAAEACYEWKEQQMAEQFNGNVLQNFKESVFQNLLVECVSNDIQSARQNEQYINYLNVNYQVLCIGGVAETELGQVTEALNTWKWEQAPELYMHCLHTGAQMIIFFEGSKQFTGEQLESLHHCLENGKIEKKMFFEGLNPMMELLHSIISAKSTVRYLNNGRWVRLHIQNAIYTLVESIKDKIDAKTAKEQVMSEFEIMINSARDIEVLKTALTGVFIHILQKKNDSQAAYRVLEYLAGIGGSSQKIEEIRKTAFNTFQVLIKESNAINTGKDFIDQTIQYVREHLSNPELSLKLIAETQLFMNVDYLSKQFSKYVGCKFSAFLAQARIEEAKRLLVSAPDITVQEVAAAVGCGNNPQYFSLLFKKHIGLTATDYIKKMRSKG